ncbi:MAG: NAD-dependent deacylase [bacterium]
MSKSDTPIEISEELGKRLRESKRVAVLTGAGISAESGVPTFRDKGGLWEKFKPEELANFDAFIRNPDLVWEWYQYRRHLINNVSPNPGHYAIVEMEQYYPEFLLITQNVDGIHQRAGSRKIRELHGNILRNFCIDCKSNHKDLQVFKDNEAPRCECGGLIRPDVVWFGEMLPEEAITDANTAARNCDLFFSIGTSGLVYPAAALPEIAKSHGAYVVEVNPNPTATSFYADEIIEEKSGIALPELAKIIKANQDWPASFHSEK